MKTRIRIILAGIAAISMLLAGCSSDSGSTTADGSDGGSSTSTHSSGLPITRGEWPFVTDERCRNNRAPGCLSVDADTGAQVSGLAAKDSVFKASGDVTVKYRGGMLVRQPSSDSTNPELRVVVTFYDVTFPRSIPGRDGLPTFELGWDSPNDLSWNTQSMGSSPSHQAWPNGEGSHGGLFYQPEPGETLTFAQAQFATGPTSLLGEEDPFISIRSMYAGPAGDATSAYFAVLDQDPDPDVIDDVRASIAKVAASNPDATGGLETFERRLSPWARDGEPLVSVNAMDSADPNESSVDDAGDMDSPSRPQQEQYLPPPPPPPDGGTELGDVDDSNIDDPDSSPQQTSPEPSQGDNRVPEPPSGDLYDLGFEHGERDYKEGNVNDPYTNDPTPGQDEDYFFGYLDGWSHAEWEDVGSPSTRRVLSPPH